MTVKEKELFVRVDRVSTVPSAFSATLDNSTERYVITRQSIAQSSKTLMELVRDKFGDVKSLGISEDLSLRAFYIFVGEQHDTASS